ncbi:hypothetical protein QNM99_26130 [Pseudomonas sp. PCH446]
MTFITLTQGFATHRDGNRVFEQAGFEPKWRCRSTISSRC